MKVVRRKNALIQLCAKTNLLSRSSVLPKRWESNSRETSFDKGHQASRSTSTSGPPCRSKFNLVGPRDYRSNIRKIIYAKSKDETRQEKYFREQQQELITWHQDFWERQNEKFSKSKKAYLQLRPRSLETDTKTSWMVTTEFILSISEPGIVGISICYGQDCKSQPQDSSVK